MLGRLVLAEHVAARLLGAASVAWYKSTMFIAVQMHTRAEPVGHI